MKSNILAAALFAFTAGGIALYPAMKNMAAVAEAPAQAIGDAPLESPVKLQRPKVDVVFALDTTGSMGGLIRAAKEKIWSIATTLAQAQPAPEIRMGLVAYRDRGDAYITQVTDLSSDLDSVYATLMDFRAEGGGDGPESVNQALADAVGRISWSSDQSAYKVIFLVGDAPPHMDYQDDIKYPQTLAAASAKGIVVNTILAGNDLNTGRVWRQIAQTGKGHYAQVAQDGNAVAIATPYDERLAELSAQLDETRLYYGSAEEKAKRELKLAATRKLHEEASVASRARRATFNVSKSGADNLLGEGELVEDVTSGRIDLDSLAAEVLPTPLQSMSPEAQKALIGQTAERRAELKKEINALAQQRARFLRDKVEAAGGASASLDQKLYDAIREQSDEKGMSYEAQAPAY
ncbi:MAG: VWA domain-containing protein [Chromatiales bacterium]|jgi:Mg-chelatase subunit ChlD